MGPATSCTQSICEASGAVHARSLGRLALDDVFSALNIGLGVFLVWRRPRDKTARLLGLALVGDGGSFST